MDNMALGKFLSKVCPGNCGQIAAIEIKFHKRHDHFVGCKWGRYEGPKRKDTDAEDGICEKRFEGIYMLVTCGEDPMKRAGLYIRVSTLDQHPETQLHELRQFASQRGCQIVEEYTDHGVSGTKARRPALDRLLTDANRRRFDVVLVWSCDRLARNTKHFLQVLDELNELGIQFLSQREAIDTDGPLGRAIVVIISAVAELERSLIVERVRAGMRRAKLDGRRIGRTPLDVNHSALVKDRLSGMSLTHVAKKYGLSRSSVVRFVREAQTRRSEAN